MGKQCHVGEQGGGGGEHSGRIGHQLQPSPQLLMLQTSHWSWGRSPQCGDDIEHFTEPALEGRKRLTGSRLREHTKETFTCTCNTFALLLRLVATSMWSTPRAFSSILIALTRSLSASSNLPCGSVPANAQKCGNGKVYRQSIPAPLPTRDAPQYRNTRSKRCPIIRGLPKFQAAK